MSTAEEKRTTESEKLIKLLFDARNQVQYWLDRKGLTVGGGLVPTFNRTLPVDIKILETAIDGMFSGQVRRDDYEISTAEALAKAILGRE